MEKVAIVINSLKKGGAEKQVVLLGRALRGIYEVRIIVMRRREGMSEELIALYGGDGGDVVALDTGCGRGGVIGLYRVLKRWRPVAVFCYLTYSNLAGAIAGRLAGVPFIYQGLRNSCLPRGKMIAEQIANRLSTGAILNNHAGVGYFSANGLKNITVIENCFPDISCEKSRDGDGEVKVVTAARFVRQKDYRTAIAAFGAARQHVPELRYRIIGHGEDESLVRSWVSGAGLGDSVEIIVNPPDVARLVGECDIYLSTSLYEGTSNSIMEAMDASLPVVATDVGDNSRLVAHGKSGFIVPAGDFAAISEAITALAVSPQMRDDMGRCGNRLLAARYGEDAFREKYVALLKQISASRAQAAQDR